ncbi:MAG: tetratricopeptide repeat protein [Prevotella sp.]|nr:tetratricopeptide repeat protein [Prevotella sp.]
MQRIAIILLLILGCVAVNATANDDTTDKRYRYLYIEAVRQQDLGNYAAALELFRRCHDLKPDAAETNYALGVFYLALDRDTLGLQYLRAAVDREPDNSEFAERLAQTYLYRNRIDEATTVYEQLSRAYADRTEYLDILVRIYERQRDYPKLLETLDRLETREGQSEEITLAKMQVHSLNGNQEGAYKELKSLIDAHPNDMNLQVMMGNWLQGNGKSEEALQVFERVMREEPTNAKGQMSLMDYHRAHSNVAAADSILYKMLVNPSTEPQLRVTLLRNWVQDSEQNGGDSLRIMELFNRVLTLPQTTSEVAEMRAAYLVLKNAPADTLRSAWEKVLSISPENISARLQLVQIMWQDSIDDNVIRECRKATEYIPDEPVLYYYLGLAQYLNEHYDDALSSLRRGVGCIKKETPANVSSDLYGMLGDLLQKLHRPEEAYVAYDSCLVYDPDKVMILNNYAYFLSCEQRDLKKAEKMSYRAITAEANNATYLDTYAWILYQQGRYDEARIYIDRALENDTVDAQPNGEVLEHAGDIYYRLGLTEEALSMWQKALPLDVEDKALLQKKIKRKKIIKK